MLTSVSFSDVSRGRREEEALLGLLGLLFSALFGSRLATNCQKGLDWLKNGAEVMLMCVCDIVAEGTAVVYMRYQRHKRSLSSTRQQHNNKATQKKTQETWRRHQASSAPAGSF
jgi:hypothetical protein